MSESILRAVLEESAQLEWDRYDNVPEHIFSKKHERSMKRIFKLFEKNRCKFGRIYYQNQIIISDLRRKQY